MNDMNEALSTMPANWGDTTRAAGQGWAEQGEAHREWNCNWLPVVFGLLRLCGCCRSMAEPAAWNRYGQQHVGGDDNEIR